MDKSGIKILKEEGAIYSEDSVVQDNNIITASGPLVADQFSQSIINKLKYE
tara:strand:- start:1512 stop:1664 length:153 start_codon:yes stop_codon:yes gene_type:complete